MIDIANTGHRQPRLFDKDPYSRSNMIYLYNFLVKAIPNAIEEIGLSKEEVRFRNGLAGGFDLTACAVLQTLGIPYVATIPFRGQESRWPDVWLRDFYNKSLGMAEDVKCDPAWLQKGLKVAYILRDHDMVDCSQKMIGLWDGVKEGGTFATWSYAQKKLNTTCVAGSGSGAARIGPKNCINLWNNWEEYKRNN